MQPDSFWACQSCFSPDAEEEARDQARPLEPIARAFNGLQYTGTLSGSKNGSIELTVKDENGNIVGTVTIDSTVYQATGTLTASGNSQIDFSGAEGQGQITGTASGSGFTGNWSGTVPVSAGSSAKGSYQGSVDAGTTSAAGLSLAKFAGTYTVHATDDPTPVSFTVDSAGKISTCNADGLKRCSGNMTFNASDNSASFTVSGDDGQSPVDTTVSVSGKVQKDGSVTGSYNFKSKTEGDGAGAITGKRDAGAPTPGGTGGTGGSAMACFNSLLGTWSHPVAGTWTFDGTNHAKSVIPSTNYGSAAQQITELSVSSCANNTMTYTIVRAALVNTVDPSFAYDKTPSNSPTAFDWSKVYTQGYSISGSGLAFGNYTYTK